MQELLSLNKRLSPYIDRLFVTSAEWRGNPLFRSKAIVLAILILTVVVAMPAFAQPVPSSGAVDFYQKIVGDWVGTYEHTTDGEQAEDIYFKFSVRQAYPNSFNGQFAYFRLNQATGDPEPAGTATIQSTVQPDGTVRNVIAGDGTILIENKLKQQSYNLVETLSSSTCGLSGDIGGKVSVSGLPFGVGKNGRVSSGSSAWSLDGDNLTINQSIRAGFKILLFSKSYSLLASSKCTRGTDVAALINKARVAERPPEIPAGS